jgi:PHD/YefM family antitoxin component YafN of YafNO toxin-antitoxin module
VEPGGAAGASGNDIIFVHFIPPPLREAGKKDLCWIVHTCDGSGCREVKHVSFLSLDSFSTFEGPPPDQKCACCVAKHHLRGRGHVIWKEQTQEACIESSAEDAQINGAAYKADAKRLTLELAKVKASLRHLRASQHVSQLGSPPIRPRSVTHGGPSADDQDKSVGQERRQLAESQAKCEELQRQRQADLDAAVQQARRESREEVASLTAKVERVELELKAALRREVEAAAAASAAASCPPAPSSLAKAARRDVATATSTDGCEDPVVVERADFVELILTLRALREQHATLKRGAAAMREQRVADRKLIRELSEAKPRCVLASFEEPELR